VSTQRTLASLGRHDRANVGALLPRLQARLDNAVRTRQLLTFWGADVPTRMAAMPGRHRAELPAPPDPGLDILARP